MKLRTLAICVSLLGPGSAVLAQSEGRAPIPHNNVINGNPFLLLAGWFNAEYERRMSSEATYGVQVSTVDFDDDNDDEDRYVSGRVFMRYYPSEALRGFFVGANAGVTGFRGGSGSETVFGAGFHLGYNWVLGSKQRLYVSLGGGADRLFGLSGSDTEAVIPNVRLINIGIAF